MSDERLGHLNIPDKLSANIPDAVGVSVEALTILGLDLARDKDALIELLEHDYSQLINDQSRSGEPYVQLALDSDHRLRAMLDAIDGKEYNGHKYPKYTVWNNNSWTSRARNVRHSLKRISQQDTDEISLRGLTGHARLALNDSGSSNTPFMHFTDKPYDKEHHDREDDSKDTQLESLANEKAKYELENPAFNMRTLDVASFAMLVLQKRIRGESENFANGTMTIPDLGRKTMIGALRLVLSISEFLVKWALVGHVVIPTHGVVSVSLSGTKIITILHIFDVFV